jgi:hypothetical protein
VYFIIFGAPGPTPFFCVFYRPSTGDPAVERSREKAALVRSMAERCVAGEFEGSAWRASHNPECIRLGIDESHIRYHMNKVEPAAVAARAAERARVATESAAAEAARVPVKVVFVERAGAQPAAAAFETAIGVMKSHLGVHLKRVAECAREDASTALQSELEVEAEEREALETELEALKLRDAAQWLEAEASLARIAALEAKLARTSSRAAGAAAAAAAVVGAAKEGATAARVAARSAQQSLKRARGRVDVLEAKSRAPSSSEEMTWNEDEVAGYEHHIGELTHELDALKRKAKGSKAEYTRKKTAVANMREKYAELQEARSLLRAKDAEIEDLKAALAEERANPMPGFRVPLFDIRRQSDKRGAPYCKYWEDTIAPAMLNTGSTPDQINEIIRKPKLNYHPLALAHPHPHTHTLSVGLYELRFYEPYESPTDLPSVTWWLKRRGIAGIQAEAYAWARVAMATKIIQGGFDETQIDSKCPHTFHLCRIMV